MSDAPPPQDPAWGPPSGPPAYVPPPFGAPDSAPSYGQQAWGQQPSWESQPLYPPISIVPGQQYAVTTDERTMGMLSHLLGLITGFIGPLVILLVKGKESAFVRHQSAEALNFQITVAIAYAVSIVLTVLCLIGMLLLPAVVIVHWVYGIIATVKSNQGVAYRYPINLRFVS